MEWSGILFFKELSGSIEEPGKLVVMLEGIYPVDKGSKVYTGFETGDSGIMSFLMSNPEFMEMNQGFIHSHNTMKAYFSHTDMSELEDNCKNHNYYLSVIVNNAGDICAKIAVYAQETYDIKKIRSKLNNEGKQVLVPQALAGTKEVMEHYDCIVKQPVIEVEDWFSKKVKEVIKACEEKEKAAKQLSFFDDFSGIVKSPTAVSFVAKFIAQDLNYAGFTYDAMKMAEKEIKSGNDCFSVEAYVSVFDKMFDQYFTTGIVSPIKVLDKIVDQITAYEESFPHVYLTLLDVCDSLLEGVEDSDEYDLTNPKNTKFHGR